MRSFREHFPIERFLDLLATTQVPGGKAYRAGLREILAPGLRAFLEERLSAGQLRPVPNAENHDTHFLSSWNRVVSGVGPQNAEDTEDAWTSVTDYLAQGAVGKRLYLVRPYAERDGSTLETAARTVYEGVVAALDAGTIPHWDLARQECDLTGEKFQVRIEDWRPTFSTYAEDGSLRPMRPGPAPSVKEIEFTFETGELIVADWFGIEGFSEAVDADRDESANVLAGREARTARYARHGFVSVNIGDTCPRLYERDGVLAFGRGEGEDLGLVITDAWSVCLIDRARLVAILAAESDAAEAEARVAAYLEESDHLVVRVEPGTHWLYMHGDHEAFAAMFAPPGVDLDGLEPLFVLSPRRLDLDATPAAPGM